MNVNDISSDTIPTSFGGMDRLALIFARQEELEKKYIPLEKRNGLRHTTDSPVDVHDRFGQAQLKDSFWRVTEELTEAVQATVDHPGGPVHAIEELADALHFLVGAYLLAGMTPDDLVAEDEGWEPTLGCRLEYILKFHPADSNLRACAYEVIHAIGCASNCLKQRPWKNSHQLVDIERFRESLVNAIWALLPMFTLFELDADDIFAMYWRKSEVNKFRIRSNY